MVEVTEAGIDPSWAAPATAAEAASDAEQWGGGGGGGGGVWGEFPQPA
jgi:hypothetical protein